jgi:tRNA-dihydrouridine synthase A
MAQDFGYDEINLNIGCPSNRVQSGRFGACLMAQPVLVAECVAAMEAAVSMPITVKTRIGIDDQDSFDNLRSFVECIATAGCRTFIIHARKAVLGGLSPKQNREIPPLRYDVVYKLKSEFPHLEIIINGGIRELDAVAMHIKKVDGVMLGREAYHNPYILAEVDHRFYGSNTPIPSREDVLQALFPYIEEQLGNGVRLRHIARHMLGLFQGEPGARAWRRHLSQNMHEVDAGLETLETAARAVLPMSAPELCTYSD